MVIPFWIMVILTGIVVEQTRRKAKKELARQSYVHEYSELCIRLNGMLKSADGTFNGPAMVVYLRELKKYPEYKDMSILFLESISITGDGRFDDIARNELKATEVYLLGLNDE
ncbi:MAG: hypothetical protein C0517_11845 [Erythrobacter sp.]|nr:hypothetical protein [Erythrobacter sp.]